ncbi:MAG: TolC family protein, partial [Prochlorococcaceae cyanobacterium]
VAAEGQAAGVQAAEAPALEVPPPPPLAPLPLAPELKGERPRPNPAVQAPAATSLDAELKPLAAPPSLALPTRTDQVQIGELRPLGLSDVETLAEVNSPALKAVAMQVEQAKSRLRATIASWYPSIDLSAGAFPALTNSYRFTSRPDGSVDPNSESYGESLQAGMDLTIRWDLINPSRVPEVAAARDTFERFRFEYMVQLRELRLRVSQTYFQLQLADDTVRIGQESVRASLVSLKDARARFQAGVATKLEVLEAETQLARDQQLLTNSLAQQSIRRRVLARLLDLPQTVTPTAKDPARVLGTWIPSLQESITAAYAIREELDQVLLDVSIANSRANAALGQVQPRLGIFNRFGWDRTNGQPSGAFSTREINEDQYTYGADNAFGLDLRWNLFDGGAAAASAREQRQRAEQSRFEFADTRDLIRNEVEESFYTLLQNDRNIATTSREVLSAREALRLARLRFQAGVTTQREVVDNQRDLTQAEVRYAQAVTDYNINLAELRRRTGLDRIALCKPPVLPATKPAAVSPILVEPQPLRSACQAQS